jgi:hypothetical protein
MSRASVFTIEVDGSPRKLFTVQERTKSGDLTVIVKHGLHFTEVGTNAVPDPAAAKIKGQIVSIHSSAKSGTNINVINTTTYRADGRKFNVRQHTKAIKTTRRFAPLYMVRCPDLRDARYITTRKDSALSLGSYDPKVFQLFYMVFVGSAERAFTTYGKHDINLIQVRIGAFRIAVLWCFLSNFSTTTSNVMRLATVRDEELPLLGPALRELAEEIANGLEEDDCVGTFRSLRQHAVKIFMDNIENDTPPSERTDISHLMPFMAFFRNPDINSQEFREHFQRFELSLLLAKKTV